MSAIDDMTGLLGVTIAAGVVTKVAQSMFPAPQQAAPTRQRKSKRSRRSLNHPGNFSNIGL